MIDRNKKGYLSPQTNLVVSWDVGEDSNLKDEGRNIAILSLNEIHGEEVKGRPSSESLHPSSLLIHWRVEKLGGLGSRLLLALQGIVLSLEFALGKT